MISSILNNALVVIIYVSESRAPFVNKIRETIALHSKSVCLAHSFVDEPYNRTSFFLLGPGAASCALNICDNAFELLDYSEHKGLHPTLGCVDHISFSPLGNESTLNDVAEIANNFAKDLSRTHDVPIFMYGVASSENMRLKEIRRKLGYFDKDVGKKCLEWTEDCQPDYLLGKAKAIDPLKGVSTIGTVPLVVNFNIRFRDEDDRKNIIKVTKAVRAISTDVEALTLPYSNTFEVACNLLNTHEYGPEVVLEVAQRTADDLGLGIVHHYCTGPTEPLLLKQLTEWNDNLN